MTFHLIMLPSAQHDTVRLFLTVCKHFTGVQFKGLRTYSPCVRERDSKILLYTLMVILQRNHISYYSIMNKI